MSGHCTSRESGLHCPHHPRTCIPKLLPYLGWAIVGSRCIKCVSDLLNVVPKVRIRFLITLVYFLYNSNTRKKIKDNNIFIII